MSVMANTATPSRRNPRRSAKAAAGAVPKRKTRRGTARGSRERAQARSERRSWHAIDAGIVGQHYYYGLPSNAMHNARLAYAGRAQKT